MLTRYRRASAAQDQEWLLGPDVLVAPVVTEGATSRSVYYPQGCWERPVTGRRYGGPMALTVPAPLDQLPYFFACGRHPFAVPSAVRRRVRSHPRRRVRTHRPARFTG